MIYDQPELRLCLQPTQLQTGISAGLATVEIVGFGGQTAPTIRNIQTNYQLSVQLIVGQF